MVDQVKVNIVERNGTELEFQEELALQASNIPFDPTLNNELIALETQAAIDELSLKAAQAASPGFVFSREVESDDGTFLKIAGGIKSNIVGLPVTGNFQVQSIVIGSLYAASIFTVNIWAHDGNMANATLVGAVTTTAAANVESFNVTWTLNSGKMLAAEVTNVTSPKPKETAVFLILKGSI